MSFPIHTVHVVNSVRDTPVTRRVLERLGSKVPVEFVEDAAAVLGRYDLRQGAHRRGKQALLLSDFRGEAIKPCPGTLDYLCCGYQILNFGSGCPLDCSYCILQDYFSNPLLVVQADSESFLAAAARRIESEPHRFFRLGTGEFADSLALDPLTGYAERLVGFIRRFPNAILELKSKADPVDALLGLDHGGRTICAWSVNSEPVVRSEEHRAAPLERRLQAAARCVRAGYRVAFHFDPLFHYPGWEADYRHTVRRLFESVPADRIAWISLGCFRFTPGLERTIRDRFPSSRHTYGDFILAADRKMRYPQPLRIHVYRRMREWILEAGGGEVLLYCCMENPAVWQAALGRCPADDAELEGWLDAAVRD